VFVLSTQINLVHFHENLNKAVFSLANLLTQKCLQQHIGCMCHGLGWLVDSKQNIIKSSLGYVA
jgi:hypothetical protein